MKYKDYNDNELLSFVHENSEEANEILFEKYKPLITSIATQLIKSCNATGLEVSDLIQEGMIALNKAITRYKETKEVSFYTFAKTCIENHLYSVILSTKRLKYKALNSSVFFDNNDDFDYICNDNLIDCYSSPEDELIDIESEAELINNIKKDLTDFESQVFELKIAGFNYQEIAKILDKSSKSIDNALQRIKTKIKNNNKITT